MDPANGKADCLQVVAQTVRAGDKREPRESGLGIRSMSLPLRKQGMMNF